MPDEGDAFFLNNENRNQDLLHYLQQEEAKHLEQIKSFIRIPSVSASTEHRPHTRQAAEWLADALRQAGLEHVQVMDTAGHPVVYGDWLHAPGKPTALIYGHYDVQPAEPLDQWETDPFEPVVKDGKLYGRGATDDKAQMFTHVATVEAYLKTRGALPLNVKFCIEGEEEIASPNLAPFLESHAELLHADLIAISDGPMIDSSQTSICYGLRGMCGFEIEVKGPKQELHSGLYGGGVTNPVTALIELLASMKDDQNRITIPGFYDKVYPFDEKAKAAFAAIPFDETKVMRELEVEALSGEAGFGFLERTSARPTLEVNGISGGYAGEGLKPIVPSSASAKVSCRLVDGQDPDEIFSLIESYLEEHKPAGTQLSVKQTHRGKPFYISPEHPYIQAAARAFEAGFGQKPVYIRSGGSIPIMEVFSRVLQAPVIMLDFGLPEENMHGPNEHFHLINFKRGTAALCDFWQEITAEA